MITGQCLVMSEESLQGDCAESWAHRRLVVAEDLVDSLAAKFGVQLNRLGALTGRQLAGCQYRHPLFERTSPVLIGGDYITTESGTGLVHTAPGHGQEDYQVCGVPTLPHFLPGKHWLCHSLGIPMPYVKRPCARHKVTFHQARRIRKDVSELDDLQKTWIG